MSCEFSNYETLDKPALISRIVDVEQLLAEREAEIEKLQLHIVNANKKLYGNKSEKLSSSTQALLNFELPPVVEISNEEVIEVPSHKRTIQRGRKPLPDNLPREQIVYEPEQTHCQCCSAELATIGQEVTEELEKIPAQLKVIEHIRIKKACNQCKGAKVLIPQLPVTLFPLEKARPGPGLLADIIVSKYVDHLPLHRQEGIFARHGIELRRQRMCDWVAGVVELINPLYVALLEEIFKQFYIHADETTLKVQDNTEEGKCHTGYLWGLHAPPIFGPPDSTGDPSLLRGALVWFHYDKSRSGDIPNQILKDYQGAVHTDAYAGYNQIYLPNRCVRVACLAHIRRKFLESQKIAGKEVTKILTMIAQLYKLESNLKTPEQRLAIRQTKSIQIVTELFDFLKATKVRTLPKSDFMKALNYALNQEVEVLRIFENGNFDLDNNAIERQMRPVAIGRKNYMFAGSHEGANRAAVLYSLLNTCKLNKVNPWEWLKDVIIRISSDNSVKPADLLPHNWKKSNTESNI